MIDKDLFIDFLIYNIPTYKNITEFDVRIVNSMGTIIVSLKHKEHVIMLINLNNLDIFVNHSNICRILCINYFSEDLKSFFNNDDFNVFSRNKKFKKILNVE